MEWFRYLWMVMLFIPIIGWIVHTIYEIKYYDSLKEWAKDVGLPLIVGFIFSIFIGSFVYFIYTVWR